MKAVKVFFVTRAPISKIPEPELFGRCKDCGSPRSEWDFAFNLQLLKEDTELCEKCMVKRDS